MIEIIKEIFLPKNWNAKSYFFARSRVCRRGRRLRAACCMGIFIIIVEDVEDGPSNYIVYYNSNYSNKEIHRTNASNYSLFRIKT